MFLLSDENMESARKRREWNHNHALVPWRISPWRSTSPFDAFKQKTLQRTPVAPLKTNLAATAPSFKHLSDQTGKTDSAASASPQ
jgi:hypothetical protein